MSIGNLCVVQNAFVYYHVNETRRDFNHQINYAVENTLYAINIHEYLKKMVTKKLKFDLVNWFTEWELFRANCEKRQFFDVLGCSLLQHMTNKHSTPTHDKYCLEKCTK